MTGTKGTSYIESGESWTDSIEIFDKYGTIQLFGKAPGRLMLPESGRYAVVFIKIPEYRKA